MRHVAQCGQVVGARELRDFLDERAEIGRRRRDAEFLVIPRIGRGGRQRADRVAGLPVVEDRRLQRNAVQVDAVLVQLVREHAAACGAVRFAEQVFRRIPAVVLRQVALDELLQRIRILVDAPEVAILVRRNRSRIAGADRVDEQVAVVDHAVRVVFHLVRRGRREARHRRLDALWRERPQQHEHRRRPAVIEERHGPRFFLRAVGRERDVEELRRRLRTARVDRHEVAGRRRVRDALPSIRIV